MALKVFVQYLLIFIKQETMDNLKKLVGFRTVSVDIYPIDYDGNAYVYRFSYSIC